MAGIWQLGMREKMMRQSSKAARSFDDAITQVIAENVHKLNSNYIAEENVLRYRHGSQWSHVDANTGRENTGTFMTHSAEFSIDVTKIAERDLLVIPKFVEVMSSEMHRQFAQSLFQLVSEETEKIGNVVSVGPSLENDETDEAMQRGFLEMSRRMELGITKYGSVSYPSVFVHPDNTRVLRLIGTTLPEDMQRELDQVQYESEIAAISKEAARLSRFKR